MSSGVPELRNLDAQPTMQARADQEELDEDLHTGDPAPCGGDLSSVRLPRGKYGKAIGLKPAQHPVLVYGNALQRRACKIRRRYMAAQ